MGRVLRNLFIFLVFTLTLNAMELESFTSYEDAVEMGKKTNKNIVLFAHSPFCPWCKKMEDETFTNEEVIKVLNEKFIFLTIDLSLDIQTDDVPNRFLPRGTPTTFVISPKEEKLLFTMRGYKTNKAFLSRLVE